MQKRKYTTREFELMRLCSMIASNYADEILGKVGSILESAHIVSETAKDFYEANEKELKNNEFEPEEYEARVEFHSLKFINKNFNIKLTSLLTA